jgi:ABC-2 type transport system permease protein
VKPLASEWTKFRTVRSTAWTVVAVAALPVAVAVLVGATESLLPDDTVLAGTIGNAVVGLMPAAILGVLVAAGEYGTATIRATLAATPHRTAVLVAKAGLVAAASFVVALGANALALSLARAMLPGHPLGSPVPALAGLALLHAAVSVLGVALGFTLRHTAGGITAAIGALLLPVLLAPLLRAHGWIAGVAPLGAAQKLVQPDGALAGPRPWITVAIVCAYCLVALVASAVVLHRSDV